MDPVSYQRMLNGGHPSLVLDRVLGTSNVKYCPKCGFASMDAAELKRHMLEHRGTRFYCVYCNKVSFSEAELNAHLKQHSSKYPFKCPHCGQGYMRRLCLVKHIDRLHNKNTSQGPAKQNPHVPVSSALSSVHTADPASLRPTIRVNVPAPTAPAVRQGRDELRVKTLETNASNATNGNAEHLTPLNGLIQHNRALTVSLPEEVTIPAGCLVELVEVKTVNGTKELKLRLVSQQENESVIKETRSTVSQNTSPGKPFLSSLSHPNAMKSMSMGMCTVNRKQFDSKTITVEHPAVCPVSISKNIPSQVNKDKAGFKRASREIINLESHRVVPNKVPKSALNAVREGSAAVKDTQSEPVSHSAALPSVICNRAGQRFTGAPQPDGMASCVSQRAVDERKNLIPEHSKKLPPKRGSDAKVTPRDVSLPVKLEPGEISLKSDDTSEIKTEQVGLNQQHSSCPSLSVLLAASAQLRPPATLVCSDTVSSPSFSNPRSINRCSTVKEMLLSSRKGPKMSTWTQEVVSRERAGEALEPEGFPVISSVFSLSQQPEDVQGAMQPLVMALRGIVMDESNGPSSRTQDHIKVANLAKEALASCAQADTKDASIIHELLLAERAGSTTQEHVEVTDGAEPSKEALVSCAQADVKDGSIIHELLLSKLSGNATQDHGEVTNGAELVKEELVKEELVKEELASCAQADTKDGSIIDQLLLTKQIGEAATEDKGNQHPPAPTHNHIKNEKPTTKRRKSKKSRCTPALKSSTGEESFPQIAAHGAAEPQQQTAKGEHDISKFLTVSLKRVQVGLWKKNKKGLKLRISKYKIQVPMDSLTDCTVIYPMPLKSDQLVTRPSPYQPVVVLNHPKPRASIQGAGPDAVADTPESVLAPKCQILKMRLSKVMGQKYEVMGCTVGVFP
ncbi:zinc finger protein 518B [Pseudoliparis swirei]|uniref:zinc finger protein 518B n=1 Tax=Pseudoliparis swirei TaxID=2059687 RepID=UPI0024BF0403|nr:zinc finger protein 518B [Pseudoliparis swirei]